MPAEVAPLEPASERQPTRPQVAVCIATCRRPVLLAGLLESLSRLTFRKQPDAEPRLVIVDNDADGSARPVVEAAAEGLPWPVHYAVEPRRNISYARNRAVQIALEQGAEFIAFIDDDEVAHPVWLDELLDAQRRFSAEIVNGPVKPRYPEGVKSWVLEGKFFEPSRPVTGDLLGIAATGNVLISRQLVAGAGGRPFDPSFGLSGGGDSHFFLRARSRGARMIWADDAVVEEVVPPSRASARWILRRAFRLGNSGVYCERALLPGPRWMAVRSAKALARLGHGLVLLPRAVPRGKAPVVAALQKVFHSLGALAAVVGIRYEEYRVLLGMDPVMSGETGAEVGRPETAERT